MRADGRLERREIMSASILGLTSFNTKTWTKVDKQFRSISKGFELITLSLSFKAFKFCCALLCVLSSFAKERTGCFAFIVLWMACYLKCSVNIPRGIVGWSAVCGISCSYSLTFYRFLCFTLYPSLYWTNEHFQNMETGASTLKLTFELVYVD